MGIGGKKIEKTSNDGEKEVRQFCRSILFWKGRFSIGICTAGLGT